MSNTIRAWIGTIRAWIGTSVLSLSLAGCCTGPDKTDSDAAPSNEVGPTHGVTDELLAEARRHADQRRRGDRTMLPQPPYHAGEEYYPAIVLGQLFRAGATDLVNEAVSADARLCFPWDVPESVGLTARFVAQDTGVHGQLVIAMNPSFVSQSRPIVVIPPGTIARAIPFPDQSPFSASPVTNRRPQLGSFGTGSDLVTLQGVVIHSAYGAAVPVASLGLPCRLTHGQWYKLEAPSADADGLRWLDQIDIGSATEGALQLAVWIGGINPHEITWGNLTTPGGARVSPANLNEAARLLLRGGVDPRGFRVLVASGSVRYCVERGANVESN